MINYFKIYSLPEIFKINRSELDKIYSKLQFENHPDKFINATEEEKIKALQKSSDINKGYMILKDDLLRAEHLLELKNIIVNKDKNNSFPIPQELLIEQLELREELSELKTEEDKEIFFNKISQEILDTISKFEYSFENLDYNNASFFVTRLRYLLKISEYIVNCVEVGD